MFRFIACGAVVAGLVVFVGCKDQSQPTTTFKNKKDEHDHSDHSRGEKDATLPSGKKCHAILSAHLSKEGNELDISFETMEKTPQPVTLPEKTKITAYVVRKGDDKGYNITFEPAEKDERKTDPAGECSRFTAKTPWMKDDDTLASVTVTIDGMPKPTVVDPWIDFKPKESAHKH